MLTTVGISYEFFQVLESNYYSHYLIFSVSSMRLDSIEET